MRVNRYTYRLQWLPDYGEYMAVCVEMPYLRREAASAQLAVAAIEQAVDQHLEDLRGTGDPVPTPLSERRHSGTIVVRTSSELHARLVLEADEQGVSMNQWIVQKISGRAPSSTYGLSGYD
jgi:predicted HicB family RNase H-like nuclease